MRFPFPACCSTNLNFLSLFFLCLVFFGYARTPFPFRFFYRHSVEEAKISKGRARVFQRVLAFITNAGARRATQFRLLLWRKDQKNEFEKKVRRSGGESERGALWERAQQEGLRHSRERGRGRERERGERKKRSHLWFVFERDDEKQRKFSK